MECGCVEMCAFQTWKISRSVVTYVVAIGHVLNGIAFVLVAERAGVDLGLVASGCVKCIADHP